MIFILIFMLSAFLTAVIKTNASKLKFIDIPNHRSSHDAPTPRGGGLAILLAFFTVLIYYRNQIDPGLFGALCMALPVALSGLIDDRYPLSARFRLGVQLLSAAGALYFLGGIKLFQFGFFEVSGIWLNIIALLIIVWMSNLYNFLDGLDGYAAAEGIFVSVGGFILFGNPELLWLASAIAGFLIFNWHKASIFMGDVGSAPLGFMFSVWMLHDASSTHFSGWLVLSILFWFDATVTLYRRWKNGERISQAHKKHMYQRLHQSGYGHSRVVLTGMGINLILLTILYVIPSSWYLVCLGLSIIILFGYLRYVDLKKRF